MNTELTATIAQAPLRISLLGGGTDYPIFFEKRPGGAAFLSATIDLHARVLIRRLPRNFQHRVKVVYDHVELCNSVDQVEHPFVRAALLRYGITQDVEVVCMGDAPARSGLGSSGAFGVALVKALRELTGTRLVSGGMLVHEAIEIEQELHGAAVGVQDPIASGGAAGLALYRLLPRSSTAARWGYRLEKRFAAQPLESHLVLVNTGRQRDAPAIVREQLEGMKTHAASYEWLLKQVARGADILERATRDARCILEFGVLLDEAWQVKKKLSTAITTPLVDQLYEVARAAGALGGKLLGAGGGGHMVFFVRPQYRDDVTRALTAHGARVAEFSIGGSFEDTTA